MYTNVDLVLRHAVNQISVVDRILGEISTDEHDSGRPLLSVVVVHKENHRPGEGFFNLAKELGKQKPDEDDVTFYAKELKSVFDWWLAAGR